MPDDTQDTRDPRMAMERQQRVRDGQDALMPLSPRR